jgi:DNA-binding CsgD family transcriptional regulator
MEGSQSSTAEDRIHWGRLTLKQRACLDLLLERKTSKQIGRELGISKYTVDQRITAARLALGASDRDDTANRYARLRAICDRIVYDPVQLPTRRMPVPSDRSDGGPVPGLGLGETIEAANGNILAGPASEKIWRHDHRFQARLAITAAILVTLIIFLLGSLGIAESLTRLVSR